MDKVQISLWYDHFLVPSFIPANIEIIIIFSYAFLGPLFLQLRGCSAYLQSDLAIIFSIVFYIEDIRTPDKPSKKVGDNSALCSFAIWCFGLGDWIQRRESA